MNRPLHILILEQSEEDTNLLMEALTFGGNDINIEHVLTREEMIAAIERQVWDIIISDYKMPNFDAREALTILKNKKIDLPFIIVATDIEESSAMEIIEMGANCIIRKELIGFVPFLDTKLKEARNQIKLKEVEERLRQAPTLHALGTLAGGVAHDFNNILGAILMYCDKMLDEIPTSETSYDDVKQIKKIGERAAKLTRQLLTFSRNQISEPTVLNLNKVISNVEKMIVPLLGEHVEFNKSLQRDLGDILIDACHLEQIIMNLVVNARDAMPSGGRITVYTENVELEANFSKYFEIRPGPYVMLSVSDTGCGMDPKTQSKIFEPFFSTKGDKGTGLGLSTVFGIVKQHKGYIVVSSQVGEGSTFKVYFPLTKATNVLRSSTPEIGQPETPINKTVLLVEDQEDFRCILEKMLTTKGHKVLMPTSSLEALEIARKSKEKIDLVITDVVMPRMGGPELAHHLYSMYPEMKILFMSGYPDPDFGGFNKVKEKAFFIEKPFTLPLLHEQIKKMFNEK